MHSNSRIWVAGSTGLAGSAITRALKEKGFDNLIEVPRFDLCDSSAVDEFFKNKRPEYVFLCAAKVGGIKNNNDYPADFIRDNLLIQGNIITCCHRYDVEKLLFLGSSCIYPKMCPQPIKEEYLMTGSLEPTNSAYAIAKIAGIEMVQAYRRQCGLNGIALMPTNLYGPNDNFTDGGHVLPSLLRRFHNAKIQQKPTEVCWGSGSPLREFLHADDLASAAIFLMQNYNSAEIVNVGVGYDISIKDLANEISQVVGFKGQITWDSSKPDGTPRKLLDISRISSLRGKDGSSWSPKLKLREGIENTYKWFLDNLNSPQIRL